MPDFFYQVNTPLLTIFLIGISFIILFFISRNDDEEDNSESQNPRLKIFKFFITLSCILFLFSFISSSYQLLFNESPLESLDKDQSMIFLIYFPMIIGVFTFSYAMIDFCLEFSSTISFISSIILYILFMSVLIYAILIHLKTISTIL